MNDTLQCHKNVSGPLYAMYCGSPSTTKPLNTTVTGSDQSKKTEQMYSCDYFLSQDAVLYDGIPGVASGLLSG